MKNSEFDMKCKIILKETCHKIGCDDYLLNMQGRCTTSYCPLKRKKEVMPMDEILFDDIKIGEVIKVKTYNSIYILESLGNKDFNIKGGKYFPNSKKAHINGCTWGGSMIWTGGIRIGMHLEIGMHNGKRIVTSPIENIKKNEGKK